MKGNRGCPSLNKKQVRLHLFDERSQYLEVLIPLAGNRAL